MVPGYSTGVNPMAAPNKFHPLCICPSAKSLFVGLIVRRAGGGAGMYFKLGFGNGFLVPDLRVGEVDPIGHH